MEQITTKHYAELVAKARAHDVYLRAIERTQARARLLLGEAEAEDLDWTEGYEQALADLSEAILDEDAKLDSRPAK